MSAEAQTAPQPGRVVVVAPMPPEKSAYALARYSRSPDSVAQSLEWVRSHDSARFLESFYFEYGHASIADLGHAILCFEGVSELAAIEIEDEPLWDGQAKSSRYQDFAVGGFVTPPELEGADAEAYAHAAEALLEAYNRLHAQLAGHLTVKYPRPNVLAEGRYRRTIEARAYDVARYLLFLGISTNIGQVTSIRTLEKQMRRMAVSRYREPQELAEEMKRACAAPPGCVWDGAQSTEPLAPTLARHAEPDQFARESRDRLARWAAENLSLRSADVPDVDLAPRADPLDEIAATLLYPVVDLPYRAIVDAVSGWNRPRKREILDVALEGRERREELPRAFRSGYSYVFDIVCDIGAYRDLHRHRRCQQIRQNFTEALGAETPDLVGEFRIEKEYRAALDAAAAARQSLPPSARDYLLPFATRCRSLFKMDFAEAEYISRVRSSVKGHISYRRVAWQIRERILEREPDLGCLIQATPPEVEDPLTR